MDQIDTACLEEAQSDRHLNKEWCNSSCIVQTDDIPNNDNCNNIKITDSSHFPEDNSDGIPDDQVYKDHVTALSQSIAIESMMQQNRDTSLEPPVHIKASPVSVPLNCSQNVDSDVDENLVMDDRGSESCSDIPRTGDKDQSAMQNIVVDDRTHGRCTDVPHTGDKDQIATLTQNNVIDDEGHNSYDSVPRTQDKDLIIAAVPQNIAIDDMGSESCNSVPPTRDKDPQKPNCCLTLEEFPQYDFSSKEIVSNPARERSVQQSEQIIKSNLKMNFDLITKESVILNGGQDCMINTEDKSKLSLLSSPCSQKEWSQGYHFPDKNDVPYPLTHDAKCQLYAVAIDDSEVNMIKTEIGLPVGPTSSEMCVKQCNQNTSSQIEVNCEKSSELVMNMMKTEEISSWNLIKEENKTTYSDLQVKLSENMLQNNIDKNAVKCQRKEVSNPYLDLKPCFVRLQRLETVGNNQLLKKGNDECKISLNDCYNKMSEDENDQDTSAAAQEDGLRDIFVCHVCGKEFFMLFWLNKHMTSIHKSKVEPRSKTFKCSFCGKHLSCSSALINHETIHTGEKPFICKVCDKGFCQKAVLKYHMRTHTGERPFKCSQCDKSFCRLSHLNFHAKGHSKARSHKCPTCGRGFKDPCHLKSHMRVHLKPKPGKYSYCETCFPDGVHPKSTNSSCHHMESEKQETAIEKERQPIAKEGNAYDKFVCHVCGKKYALPISLQKHMNSVHGMQREIADVLSAQNEVHLDPKPYKCPYCGKGLGSSTALKLHEMLHTEKKPFVCEKCGKGFCNRGQLKGHMNSHTGERPYKCHLCDKSYLRPQGLKFHIRCSHGQNDDGKKYQCPQCGVCLCSAQSLKCHIRTHTDEKPFKCDQCDKSFATSNSLAIHKRQHTGEKPYKCPFCDKSFRQHPHLNVHIRTHTGETPYKCSVCGKGFGQSCHLKTHMKVHTGEKPYKCSYCDMCFAHKDTMRVHERSHTGEMPYVCEDCGARFKNPSSLRLHIKVHKGDKKYKCSECDAAFYFNTGLRHHKIEKHSNVRPHICNNCGDSFSFRGTLMSHMKKHGIYRPYVCEQCSKKFKYAHDLRIHERTNACIK